MKPALSSGLLAAMVFGALSPAIANPPRKESTAGPSGRGGKTERRAKQKAAKKARKANRGAR